jgi:hypothetical protein
METIVTWMKDDVFSNRLPQAAETDDRSCTVQGVNLLSTTANFRCDFT